MAWVEDALGEGQKDSQEVRLLSRTSDSLQLEIQLDTKTSPKEQGKQLNKHVFLGRYHLQKREQMTTASQAFSAIPTLRSKSPVMKLI